MRDELTSSEVVQLVKLYINALESEGRFQRMYYEQLTKNRELETVIKTLKEGDTNNA